MTRRSTVAVTGASGFLGSYLVPALTSAGHDVVAVGRQPPRAPVTYRHSDYDEASLRRALAGTDIVVHLAARTALRGDDPLDLGPYLTPNVLTIRGLCEAADAGGAKRVVLASSRAVYPASSAELLREGRDERPRSAYGLSKLFAENLLDAAATALGLSQVRLRLAAIYGDGERESPVLMHFARLAGQGQTLSLSGNVAQRIDQLYVRDACEAIVAAVAADDSQGPINIGSGRAVSIRELATTINDVFGNEGNLTDEDAVNGPDSDATLDITRAQRLLRWKPRFTLRTGLQELRAEREARNSIARRE